LKRGRIASILRAVSSRLTLSLALSAALTLAGSRAHAQLCTCPATRPPPVALAESDAVFEGQVTAMRDGAYVSGGGEGSQGRWVTLLVLREWKGATAGTTRHVFTPTACAVPFEAGTTWVVYARHGGANHDLRTTRCQRTRAVATAREDLVALGIPGTQILAMPGSDALSRAQRTRVAPRPRGALRRIIRRRTVRGVRRRRR
jgi:hypothetical protein